MEDLDKIAITTTHPIIEHIFYQISMCASVKIYIYL